MLTPSWPLEYDPRLPPRRDSVEGASPVTVHLDQWCFDHLAWDRAGRPHDPSEVGCFEYFRELALDGKAVFVLAQTHYWENWRRENDDARWDTAVVMAELTGFNTITSTGLEEWDALEAVATFTGVRTIEPPQVFGWGLAHCLRGTESSAKIIDASTGQPPSWDDLPEGARHQLDEVEQRSAERVELGLLARRDPRLEPHMLQPFNAVPDDGRGDLLVQEEDRIRNTIDEVGRNESNVRVILEGACIANETTLRYIRNACQVLGLDRDSVLNELAKHSNSEQNRQALSTFVASMPIQGRYTELRVRAHLQVGRKRKASDGRDYFAIASISPFVDYLVTDKSMYLLTEAAGFKRRGGATIVRRLADLRQQMESDLGT